MYVSMLKLKTKICKISELPFFIKVFLKMRITCNILSLIFDFKAEEFYDLDLTCLYSFTWNTDIREFLWSGTKKGSSFYIFLLLTFYLCGRGFKVCQTLDLFDV